MELTSRGMIALTFACFIIACKGKAVMEERPKYYGGYEYNYNFQNDQHDVRPLYDYSHMFSSEPQYQQSDFNLPNSYDGELDDVLENFYIPKKLDSIYEGIKTSYQPEYKHNFATTSAKYYDEDNVYNTQIVSKKIETQCDDCFEEPVVIKRKKSKPTRKFKPAKYLYPSDDGYVKVDGKETHSEKFVTECDDCAEIPVVIERKKAKPNRKVITYAASTAKDMYSDDYTGNLKVVGKKKQYSELKTKCTDCYEEPIVVERKKSESIFSSPVLSKLNLQSEYDDSTEVPVVIERKKAKTTPKLKLSASPKTIYKDDYDSNFKIVGKKHTSEVQAECKDCYEEPVIVERKKSEDIYKNSVSSKMNLQIECDDCTEIPVVIDRKKAKPTRNINKLTTEDLLTEDYDLEIVDKKTHSGQIKSYAAPENLGIYNKPTGTKKINKEKPKNENSIKPVDYQEFDSLNIVKSNQKNNTKYKDNVKSDLKIQRSDDSTWIDESKGPDINVLDLTDESADASDLDEQFLDVESFSKKENEKSECSIQSKSSNKKSECVDNKQKPEINKRKPEKQKPEVNKQKPQKPEVNKQKPKVYEKPVKVSHAGYENSENAGKYKITPLDEFNDLELEDEISDLEIVGRTKENIPEQKCTKNFVETSNGEMKICETYERLPKPSKSQSTKQNAINEKFPKPSDDDYLEQVSRDELNDEKYSDAAYSESMGISESFETEPDLSVVESHIIGKDVEMTIPQDDENFENAGSGLVAEDGIEKIPDMSDGSDKFRSLSFINSNILPLLSNPDEKENILKPCVTRNNESGFCRYVQQCQVLNIATSLEKLLNNACVMDDVFIGVCCPEFPVETVRVHWDDSENTAIDTAENEEALSQIEDCGRRSKEELGNQSWPWKAPLVSMSNGKIFCGGVVIGNEYVLTAAHCTTKIPKNQILVRIGQYDESSGEDFIVTEIKRHAQYNSRTLQNDIALLKLGRRVSHSQHSGIICLPEEEDDHEMKDDKALLLGWRRLFGENPHTGEALEIMPIEKCRSMMNANVLNSVLCTEARKEDGITCNADSGAPLVIEHDGKYEVIGILSWNRNDCDSRFPSIFSRVSSYVKWIKRHAV